MRPARALLDELTAANAETTYGAFYTACKAADPTPLIEPIIVRYHHTASPVVRSYCLLMLGAVVDAGQVGPDGLIRVGAFLETVLAGLDDFTAKDAAGRFVHFINHAANLALSLSDAKSPPGWGPLLQAYQRADAPFAHNEPAVLAHCFLEILPKGALETLLAALRPDAANDRALWSAMYALNATMQRYDPAEFAGVVRTLARLVGADNSPLGHDIRQIKAGKAAICARVLKALPDWFGQPEPLAQYIKDADTMPMLAAFHGAKATGFVTLNATSTAAVDLHVMGVDPAYHHRGIGRALVGAAANFARGLGASFLTVKTLGPSMDYAPYGKTRAFYRAAGFLPLEESDKIWGPQSPCLTLCKWIGP